MSSVIWASGDNVKCEAGEIRYDFATYRCHLAITKDDDDSYSVIVLNLPGAGSCGSTEEESIENTRDAVRELVAHYLENGEIPWKAPGEYSVPDGVKLKWILVDA